MKHKDGWKRILRNTGITLAFPVAMYLLMEAVCWLGMGTHVMASVLDIKNLIRNVGISAIVAYALSFNLTSGRFDLSLGSQSLVATIIGGNIALKLGFNGIGLLLMVILFGLLFGALVGVVFIVTRVPPMVLGIGMGLIYESISFVGSGSAGLQLFGAGGMEVLTDVNFTILILALVAVFVMVLLGSTRFSYKLRAIQGSQKIARESGINIFGNAVVCYTLAGGLVAIAGVFNTAFQGSLAPSMGFSSNGMIMANCFTMFLGGLIAKWSNSAVGILMAAITLKIFSAGLTALKLTSAVNSTINMLAFLVFLVYLANQDALKNRRAERRRVAEAKEKRQRMALG